jgi:hypothetical protein
LPASVISKNISARSAIIIDARTAERCMPRPLTATSAGKHHQDSDRHDRPETLSGSEAILSAAGRRPTRSKVDLNPKKAVQG